MTASAPIDFQKSTTVRAIVTSLRALALLNTRWAARTASYLFFRAPPRRGERPEEADVLSWGRPFTVPHALGDLSAWRWGEGPRVVLVHGWGGSAAQMTPFVQPLVEAGHEVVAVDFAGHGRSPGSQGSIPDVARTLVALVQQVGPVDTVLAHSLGVSGVLLALELGLATERVVAIAGPARPYRWFQGWVGAVVEGEAYELERRRVERDVFDISMEWLDGPARAPLRGEPLLWIHCADDKEVEVEGGRELTDAWPGAVYVETQKLGHKRILRDEGVIRRVVDWISGRPTPA